MATQAMLKTVLVSCADHGVVMVVLLADVSRHGALVLLLLAVGVLWFVHSKAGDLERLRRRHWPW